MRQILEDAFTPAVMKMLRGMGRDYTPDMFQRDVLTLDLSDINGSGIQTDVASFDLYAWRNSWATGSINGIDVHKIKTMVNYLRMRKQETLEFTVEPTYLARGNLEMSTSPDLMEIQDVDSELPSPLGRYTLRIRMPEGWDGRNSFVKMDWDAVGNPMDSINGPGAAVKLTAGRKQGSTSWTILKTQGAIEIRFTISDIWSKSDVNNTGTPELLEELVSMFKVLKIKVWRNGNAGRR